MDTRSLQLFFFLRFFFFSSEAINQLTFFLSFYLFFVFTKLIHVTRNINPKSCGLVICTEIFNRFQIRNCRKSFFLFLTRCKIKVEIFFFFLLAVRTQSFIVKRFLEVLDCRDLFCSPRNRTKREDSLNFCFSSAHTQARKDFRFIDFLQLFFFFFSFLFSYPFCTENYRK